MENNRARPKKENVIAWRQRQRQARALVTPSEWRPSWHRLVHDFSIEETRKKEYLLTLGNGGYASSTITGMNTRKYHGILVYSTADLQRRMVLNKVDEEIITNGTSTSLGVNEYADNTIADNTRHLAEFNYAPTDIRQTYRIGDITLNREIRPIPGTNSVILTYTLKNQSLAPVEVKIHPLTNSRSIHDLTRENNGFTQKSVSDHDVLVKTSDDCLFLFTKDAEYVQEPYWHKGIRYEKEDTRGEESVEDLYHPGHFVFHAIKGEKKTVEIRAIAARTEEETAQKFRETLSTRPPETASPPANEVFTILANNQSFIVEGYGKKTVIAGYPWFNDWGRDALISLPGLTLVTKMFSEAEKILEHFLNHMKDGFTPTKFVDGQPQYYDVDGGLWLIDRVRKYVLYAGPEKGRQLLHTYWWNMKDMISHYEKMVRDGILYHDRGTWMDTLERHSAVEIQGLWYNALKSMEDLSEIMEDPVDYGRYTCAHEQRFMDSYWNGHHLRDCLDDEALRPNQAILLSLDYNVVEKQQAQSILSHIHQELLTPYGLRTLSPTDPRYKPRYDGGWRQREQAYHNGTAWPWLAGPFLSALRKYESPIHVQKAWDSLSPLYTRHLWDAGLGYISEVFDADPPHTPRGCTAQAWSMAELVRAFYEDVTPKKQL